MVNGNESCKCQDDELLENDEGTSNSVSDNSPTVQENDNSDVFLYVISFLLPIIGIISGSILLTTDNKKSIGRDCILASLAGILIVGLIVIGIKAS